MRLHLEKTYQPSEIASEEVWLNRRKYMVGLGQGLALGAVASAFGTNAMAKEQTGVDMTTVKNTALSLPPTFAPNSYQDITTYNNFYEFGFDKSDPARYSGAMRTRPWTVSVEGEVNKPQTFDIEDLLKLSAQEERVYRFRCVEAWSMVIPWVGYSLSKVLEKVEPNSRAKYVEFVTATQPDTMPGLRSRVIDWPYREVLRIDEAMNPLTLLAFGIYGKTLLNQSGAPLRLVVPWKYGFKSAKSLVAIRLVEKMPTSSWMDAAPNEYGFYGNVNPTVPHPRWSQASERRIGGNSFFQARQNTLMFNGYEDHVASLYTGLDLRKNF